MSWLWTRFTISQLILLFFSFQNSCCHPYNRVLMVLCLDPQVIEKPLCSLSREITCLDFHHLGITTIWRKEHGHIWACQLRPPTLSTSIYNWRTRAHLQIKKGEFIVFFHFSHRTCMKSHLFHSVFLDSAVNKQKSILKEGENKAYWLQHHAAAGKDIAQIWWIVTSVRNNPRWSCSLFCSPRQEITFKVFRV